MFMAGGPFVSLKGVIGITFGALMNVYVFLPPPAHLRPLWSKVLSLH